MNFPSFSTILTNVQSKMNQYASGLLDFGVGKPFYALANMIASGMTFLTGQTQTVLANTRLSTSDYASAVSFFAQFGFTMLPAVASTGSVTFSRYVAASASLILPGVQVKTVDGQTVFTVTTDITNPLWNTGLGGYLVPISTISATVPVQASVAGTASNVQAGTISLIASSIAGIDLVTNTLGFTNGFDPETVSAAQVRFWQWLQTRFLATDAAVEYAVSTVQQGLSYAVVENPSTRVGSFNVVVDDGSGAPSTTLLNTISAAVDLVRPLSVSYNVIGANVVYANISLNIIPANGYSSLVLQPLVAQAITAWVNGLGVGVSLGYNDIASVAKIEGVYRLENITLNYSNTDIGGGKADSVHISSLSVNV
jgi:hypothetical protein